MSAAASRLERALDAQGFAALCRATPAQLADLERFREMLTARNAVMNLVGPASLPDFWSRHAWDSAQLLKLAPEALTWADLGAGAGFPGLVLAILGKGRAGFRVDLVESMAKRCRFLAEAVETLELRRACAMSVRKTSIWLWTSSRRGLVRPSGACSGMPGPT